MKKKNVKSSTKPFFSIVVPVCKTEQYLEQCITSIKNQSFKDFECHIVNDGSSGVDLIKFAENQDEDWKHKVDLSKVELKSQIKTIFDSVVGNDKRFIYHEKPNGGLSSVRNYIRDKLMGKWLITVDADDWVKADHLQNFANSIEKHNQPQDIVFSSQVKFYNEDKTEDPKPTKVAKITLSNLLYVPRVIQWNYVSKVSIIQKHKLLSDERVGPGPAREDKLIGHGYDDIIYSWKYFEAVAEEENISEFNFVDINQDTYMFRSVDRANKDAIIQQSSVQYGDYVSNLALKNSSLSVKLVGLLFPLYIRMLHSPSKLLSKFIIKFAAFPMRLVSRFYF
jgi:glycosyltransferase involved in cell wall biosynthesis